MNGQNWVKQHPTFFFIILFVLQWLLLYAPTLPVWDGAFYYSYATSLAFDGDLHLANNLVDGYAGNSPDYVNKQFDQLVTETGRVNNVFAIGSGLWWLSPLLLTRFIGGAIGLFGEMATGYERPFLTAVGSFSALTGFLALWLGYKTSREKIGATAAFFAILTLMFASPMIYFQFIIPYFSHTASALFPAVAVYLWSRNQDELPTVQNGFWLGIAIGCATLMRWQNGVYVLLPFFTAVFTLKNHPIERRTAFNYLAAAAIGTILAFSIQSVAWYLFYGDWLTIPQGNDFINWRGNRIVPVLFSTYRGLFPWMPAAIVAIIGLLSLTRRRLAFGLPLLLVLLANIYINGSVLDWFGGGGFGPRRFISDIAILLIGYSEAMRLLLQIRWGKWIATLLAILLALQQWVLIQYGILEKIGGTHTTFGPTFEWIDDGYLLFMQKIVAHLPELVTQPLQFLTRPNSFIWRGFAEADWQWERVLYLGVTTAVFLLIIHLAKWLLNPERGSRFAYGAAAFIVLFNFWLLFFA